MCLIIMQTIGKKLPEHHLDNGWSHNPDGAGYAFVNGRTGKLEIRKGFFKLAAFKAAYRNDHAAHGHSSPFVIHFRYATHGGKTEENCHPHPLSGGNVALAHNGVLRDFEPPPFADYSDTVHFCNTVLAYRVAAHLVDENFRGILAEMIGTGNKFVLLSHTREVSIVNEAQGLWENGNWYSNTTHRQPAAFGKFKRGVNTSHFRGSLFEPNGQPIDPWEEVDREYAEDELEELTRSLDEFDFTTLTREQQDDYLVVSDRIRALEKQLDSRLREKVGSK